MFRLSPGTSWPLFHYTIEAASTKVPGAKTPIILPQILTQSDVLGALAAASRFLMCSNDNSISIDPKCHPIFVAQSIRHSYMKTIGFMTEGKLARRFDSLYALNRSDTCQGLDPDFTLRFAHRDGVKGIAFGGEPDVGSLKGLHAGFAKFPAATWVGPSPERRREREADMRSEPFRIRKAGIVRSRTQWKPLTYPSAFIELLFEK
jgi:hypothetical protein